ncbi:hypothetical protein [Clostridium sp. JN-9]|uniref:hypothetical protein n=1 Tax=Clostridium sp. JN-9 TaxID=2507159 RepID=UPI000FFE2D72|nr:hypothetical protein [Clostridium sp. JN-9]QAT39724.1 hypothetical protein EQM05_05375 [Clostridium sp. JN-9]
MKGLINNLDVLGCQCTLYLPPSYQIQCGNYSVVYMNGENDISEIMKIIEPDFNVECEEFLVVDVHSENWGSDYTLLKNSFNLKMLYYSGIMEDILQKYLKGFERPLHGLCNTLISFNKYSLVLTTVFVFA